MKLIKIQQRISELKKKIHTKPKEILDRLKNVGVTQGQLDRLSEKETMSMKEELEILGVNR